MEMKAALAVRKVKASEPAVVSRGYCRSMAAAAAACGM